MALRIPESVRFTVDAQTLINTSSSFGTGLETSINLATSGGPYSVYTTAFIFLTALVLKMLY